MIYGLIETLAGIDRKARVHLVECPSDFAIGEMSRNVAPFPSSNENLPLYIEPARQRGFVGFGEQVQCFQWNCLRTNHDCAQ